MNRNLYISVDNSYSISKKLIHNIVGKLKKELHFTVNSLYINFVKSNTIIEVNTSYLGHNYSTDIITFNYSGSIKELDGEIFISVEDAKENAKYFRCRVEEEILRLIIHGILHMLGYEDGESTKKKEMKKLENYLVNVYQSTIEKETLIYDI